MRATNIDTEVTKASNTLKEQRNAAIKKEFRNETSVKHLSPDYVIEQLSKKYYLSTTTVWRIISDTGYYNKKTA